MVLILLEELIGFSDMNLVVKIGGALESSQSLRMTAVFFRGALVLTLSVVSWLQCRSLSMVAQILHPAGIGFLATTIGLSVFPVQILDMELHETVPWAVGAQLEL